MLERWYERHAEQERVWFVLGLVAGAAIYTAKRPSLKRKHAKRFGLGRAVSGLNGEGGVHPCERTEAARGRREVNPHASMARSEELLLILLLIKFYKILLIITIVSHVIVKTTWSSASNANTSSGT